MEQESYPLKSCPHPRRLVQVNIGLWVSFQFFSHLAADGMPKQRERQEFLFITTKNHRKTVS